MELAGAYSSRGSDEDVDGSVQRESNGSNEGEIISDDDVIAVYVQKAAAKPKTFGSELQVHNYFSLHAKQPTAEEKVQLAKDPDVSHVMLLKGKLAVFVISATEKDKLRRRIYQRNRSNAAKASLIEKIEVSVRERFEKLSEDASIPVDAAKIEIAVKDTVTKLTGSEKKRKLAAR